MAEPTLDLAQAKRLMDALYEPGDSFYVLSINDHANEQHKKRGTKKKPEARQHSWTYNPESSPGAVTEFA